MNEPIINPWLFYWIGIIDPLRAGLAMLGVILAVCFGIMLLNASDFDKPASELRRNIVFGVLLLALALFIPSKGTLVQMVIASKVTPANIQMVEDKTTDLADGAFTRIEQSAINIIKEVKK